MTKTSQLASEVLQRLGVEASPGDLVSRSPIDGAELGRARMMSADAVGEAVGRAEAAFKAWRQIPAPRRGELVRLFGEELRRAKDDLGLLRSEEHTSELQSH